MRRSTRSLRSGYAFAHQEGFGELITSGLNMRSRVEKSESRDNNVELTKVRKFNVVGPPESEKIYNSTKIDDNKTEKEIPKESTSSDHESHDHEHDKHVVFCERL